MSQRKEKYIRNAMEQYEGIARDVDMLKNKVGVMERAMREEREARAVEKLEEKAREERTARAMKRIQREERDRRLQRRRRKTAVRVAIAAALLAAAVMGAMFAGTGVKAEAEIQKRPARYEVAGPVMLPEPAELLAAERMPDTESDGGSGEYCEEIPLTREEQLELRDAAHTFNIWYPLAVALVDVETNFRNIDGDGGNSIGYMQVNKDYHKDLMEEIGADDLRDPEDNFRTGLAILAGQMERTDTEHEALMAYNMGYAGASKAWERGVYESEYSRKVMERAEYWAGVMGCEE